MKRLLLAVVTALTLAAPASANVVAGWGSNTDGNLGTGYRSGNITRPVEGAVEGAVKVVSAYHTAYALLPTGEVLAWGGNEAGQIGDGTRINKVEPTRVRIDHVVDIAAAGAAPVALRSDGTVWTWGGNSWGQIGNGTVAQWEGEAHPKPEQVPGLTGVTAVYAGGANDAALKADGTLCLWGEDKDGQIGDASKETKPSPVCDLSNVRFAALGGVSSLGGHTLVALNNGTVLGFGSDKRGQLGTGITGVQTTPVVLPALEGATALASGLTQSLAVLGGQVVASGGDTQGELGYEATEVCPGRKPGETLACSRFFRPTGVAAQEVSAGLLFSVARSGESVYAWGINNRGEVGNGTEVNEPTPTLVQGIVGVTQVSASEYFVLTLAEAAASPDFKIIAGSSSLTAEWANLPGEEKWQIQWRRHKRPVEAERWTPYLSLPYTVHSYTVTGLEAGAEYEVRLRRYPDTIFGRRIGFGVPLP